MSRARLLIGGILLIALVAGGALWAKYGVDVLLRSLGGFICG